MLLLQRALNHYPAFGKFQKRFRTTHTELKDNNRNEIEISVHDHDHHHDHHDHHRHHKKQKIYISSFFFTLILSTCVSTLQMHRYISTLHEKEDLSRFNEIPITSLPALNIVILYPDDWRYNDLEGLSPIVKTPFLKYLASLGIHFTHNAVTTSICWISRATMFTGQYVSRHASTYLYRPHFATTFLNITWPYQLQKQGYFVGHVGKWQYDDNDGYLSRMFNFTRIHEGYHWYLMKRKDQKVKVSAAVRARDDAFEFLDKRPKDKPFALTVAFYPPKAIGNEKEPGAQWEPTKKMKEWYRNESIPLPPNYHDITSIPEFLRYEKNQATSRYIERWRTYEHYQEGMKNYYALISQVDKMCGQIFTRLEKENLLNTTMIIFTTDNGLMHGAHRMAGKWYPYEESIRVPLIIYDPRMAYDKRGTLDDSMTLNIDLAETILGAANIVPPDVMQGRDISDLYLKRTNKAWRTEFYYEYPIGFGLPKDPRVTALVEKDWKYIHWPERNVDQLFDLKNDPYELYDLAVNVTWMNWRRIRDMKRRHKEWRYKVMEPVIPDTEADPLRLPGSVYKPPEVISYAKLFYSNQMDMRLINGFCSGWYGSRLICIWINQYFWNRYKNSEDETND